jgi:hypothetical protein
MNPYTTHGVFSWVELLTTDLAAAKKFYGEVFGWQIKACPEITSFETAEIGIGSEMIGTMVASPPENPSPSCWGTYVTVSDIAKTLELAVRLGGSVVFGPMDIPGVGRIAVVRDPQGAHLMPVQYAMPSNPPGLVPEFRPARAATMNAFSWWELMTSDFAAARAFYGGVFGWTFQRMPNFEYEVIEQNGLMIGGLMGMPPQCPAGTPPCWNVYVNVADADAICENVRRNGGTVLAGPEDIPTIGRFAVLQDPTGGVLSVMAWSKC